MGRTSQEDELDDLRANLAEDPELADAFARLEAAKDSRRERRSGSEFGNPLKGFVPIESAPSGSGASSAPSISTVPSVPSERAVSSRSGLPSFHDVDDDAPPDTPTRRYVKSEHADPSLGEAPPSTHRPAHPPGARRGALPNPTPPPARGSAPGPMSAPRGKQNALVYGPVSSPNGAPSAPDPLMPVNSGPMISVRNTDISMPPDEYGSRVTPVVGAPMTPASPAYPSAPSSSPIIDPGFALQPIADSVESGPELPENDARAVAPPVAAPAIHADEREGAGTRVWLLIAATLLSAAATVAVLMFVVRPLKPESAAAPTSTAITAAPPVNTQVAAPVVTAPPPPPAATEPAAPTPAEAVQPPPTSTAVAATPPTPTAPGAGPTPGGTGFVPQFTKQPTGAPPPTARPPATAKPVATTTAAPKSTVSPIFEFER
jgi:hypothetical protein